MSIEHQWFRTHLGLKHSSRRKNATPHRRLYFEIHLSFFNAITWNGECIEYSLIARRSFYVPISDVKQSSTRRHIWTKAFADHLSEMGFPEDEQPASIEKIFNFFDVTEDPEVPIAVVISDITSHISESESESEDYIIDRVTRESFETYMPKLIPATKSSIEGLEIVRLDSLEEAAIRQATSCVICMESLDHHLDININVAEDDHDEDDHHQPKMITRLPCLHHFHGHCIVQWLKISHLCPICRYPMPIVEVGAPSEPKQRIVGEVGEPSEPKDSR